MRDVVVVGSLNVDVSLRAPRLPRAGETLRASGLEVGSGGKGSNQAIAAGRLGARVHLVGCAGDDAFAELPLGALSRAGVDTMYVRRIPGGRTGTAAIIVDENTGQNAIVVYGGANHEVTPSDVRGAIAAFRSSAVLLVQLELPLDAVEAALDLARETSVKTVLDPAPVPRAEGPDATGALPDALLRKVDVLTPNETEATALSGIEVVDVESAAAAAARLQARTQGDVLVTLGASGCLWAWSTGFEHVPAPSIRPRDTTGAGDAFNAGLAVSLSRGEPLAHAIQTAIRTGTASTLRPGAAESMPTQKELEQLP